MSALRAWWIAVESGWRAGLRQYRKRRTELAKPSKEEAKPEVGAAS